VALREPTAENSRFSETHYRMLLRKERFALLALTPLTGRTHQIRAHLAAIGFPVLGDRFYNPKSKIELPFLALHACYLAFTHPATKKRVTFHSFIPKPWHDFWNNSK
jgi:23S rRNA-/tRNA-specific pseudouridylate synthase